MKNLKDTFVNKMALLLFVGLFVVMRVVPRAGLRE
jgi:hypothetical protein